MLSCNPLVIGRVEGGNNVTAICLRGRHAADEKIVDLVIDEIAEAFEVRLVDVKTGSFPKEALELGHAHDVRGRDRQQRSLRNHG
jgi:hypothetical protein